MKPTTRGDIRKMAQEVAEDYMSSEHAVRATGFTYPQLSKWCEARNIRHIKQRGRWMYHREDLLTAFKNEISDKIDSARVTPTGVTYKMF